MASCAFHASTPCITSSPAEAAGQEGDQTELRTRQMHLSKTGSEA